MVPGSDKSQVSGDFLTSGYNETLPLRKRSVDRWRGGPGHATCTRPTPL